MKIVFNKETKRFGILADRVNKAVHEQILSDGIVSNLAKIAASGEKDPKKSYDNTISRSKKRRSIIAKDALNSGDSKAKRNWELSKAMTNSPTNPRNYVQWARDIALKATKHNKKYKDLYNDLVNHKGTPDTNQIMKDALDRVEQIESERADRRKHYDTLSPSIHNGREFPYNIHKW